MTQPTPTPQQHESLQGHVPPLATPQERNAALDKAFDYRGDVTIQTADGQTIEGYIFDRRRGVPEPYVRIIPKDRDQFVQIKYDQITRLVFSGRDTAAGKSWEAWVRKYQESKRSRRDNDK